MKREGMPTQRCEEKRVEERPSMQGGKGEERERQRAHAGVRQGEREKERRHVEGGERERERAHACRMSGERERKRFGSSSPGPALCKLGLARSAVQAT